MSRPNLALLPPEDPHGPPGASTALVPADAALTAIDSTDIASPEHHVRFPWADLHAIYGPLLPGELHIVSARTGSGKTLFVRNWIRALAVAETPIAYFSTETPRRVVLRDLVCADLHLDPVPIARGDFSRVDGGREALYAAAQRLGAFLFKPPHPGGFPRLGVYDHPRPSVAQVRAAMVTAVEAGCRVAVIDHVLRLNLGDGTQIFAEVTAAARALKQLAEDLGIAVVITSQQSRQSAGGDRLAWFAPPDLSALKGAGTLEEEADGVLFLHRLLRDDLSDKQRSAIRTGLVPLQEAIAANLMGAAIGKHRLDGKQVGSACRLWVEHGRVSDLPAAERLAWQQAQHAIRTTTGAA